MMCDECGIRPAVISLTTIVQGEKQERKLCSACMSKLKNQLPQLNLSNLAGLLSGFLAASAEKKPEPPLDITCTTCGTTYEDFRKSGLLGCADCYKAFHDPLEALLKRVHGHTHHAGRVPGGQAGKASIQMEIDHLKEQLVRAIAAEEYEEAASLRDRVRALQTQLTEENSAAVEVKTNE